MKNIWIWYSSLSEKIFLGKNKDLWNWHREFTWNKKDVTNSFLFIVEQYFKIWTSRVINQWKKSTMYISIENTKEAKEKLIKSLQEEIETT